MYYGNDFIESTGTNALATWQHDVDVEFVTPYEVPDNSYNFTCNTYNRSRPLSPRYMPRVSAFFSVVVF